MRSTEFPDSRTTYFWDRYKLTGVEWQEILGLDNVAWDIYFLYSRNSKWGETPSLPDFMMDQIGLPEDVSHHLDGEKLAVKIAEMMKEK